MQSSVAPTLTTEPRRVHLPTLEALVTKSMAARKAKKD